MRDFRWTDILTVWESIAPVDKGWFSEGGGLYPLGVKDAEGRGAWVPDQKEELKGTSKSLLQHG